METVTQSIFKSGKLLVKGVTIFVMVLVLQVAAFYVMELIREREQRQKDAITEVSSKWAGKQTISGPVLVLPYWKLEGDSGSARKKHFASFLPDELTVNAQVKPEEKHRGIYKVMLYSSKVELSGSFASIPYEKLSIPATDIIWSEAFLRFHISDLKGLNEELRISWNGKVLPMAPASQGGGSIEEGMVAPLSLTTEDATKPASFSTTINLNGSEQFLFTPTGRSTTVQMNSTWPHPSFNGSILPQTTAIKDSGFSATWRSLAHKRPFPQQWTGDAYPVLSGNRSTQDVGANVLQSSSFGVDLFVPVNGFQKTMRSIKYSVLCVLLTFAAFFLIETSNRKSIHPFHYGLVGIALILFYTLLLSFSEYIGFNLAYVVASVFTITLIAWFVKGLLQSGKLTMILTTVLVLLYLYVFTILQLQDFSLILGSLGLFFTLAVIMHFS